MEFEVNIVEGQGFSVEVYKKFNFFIPFKDMDKIDYMKEENFNEVKSLVEKYAEEKYKKYCSNSLAGRIKERLSKKDIFSELTDLVAKEVIDKAEFMYTYLNFFR